MSTLLWPVFAWPARTLRATVVEGKASDGDSVASLRFVDVATTTGDGTEVASFSLSACAQQSTEGRARQVMALLWALLY